MRPGLTGLWQVSARSDPSLESRIRFDLLYLNQWSLLLDAKIMVKTVPAVVLAKGGRVDGALRPRVVIDDSVVQSSQMGAAEPAPEFVLLGGVTQSPA